MKPGDELWDTVIPALGVRAGTRRRTYFLRYRLGHAHRRYRLGHHPVVSLAKARQLARSALERVAQGEDPGGERQARRDLDGTFRAMAIAMLDAKSARLRVATKNERERIIERELIPVWGNRPAGSINRADVVTLVDRIARRAPIMSNRVLEVIKVTYNDALHSGWGNIEANPAALLKPRGAQSPSRRRFLGRDEIRTLWKTLDREPPVTAAAFRIVFLTAQRVGNVMSMRWADVDDTDVWTIPEESFKGRRLHLVPLNADALAVIESLRPISGQVDEDGKPAAYIFPSPRRDGKTPHMNSMNAALRRIRERSGLDHFTLHDARRTFRTHATRPVKPADRRDPAGLGAAPHVADAVLGHVDRSLGTQRYQGEPERYLLAEKREALERWGAYVRKAVNAREDDG